MDLSLWHYLYATMFFQLTTRNSASSSSRRWSLYSHFVFLRDLSAIVSGLDYSE